MGKLKITLKKSLIGRPAQQRRTAEALGLRKIGQQVIQPDNPATWGQIEKLSHLVEVEEISED
ncbi:LSU ribosomal protein L30P [Thermanaeromonas toyohensis ToBE]|uniref:Large ribosomal subunit protein uL30 n=1 Tax=Thermanaeromonas toyohensis ToBE TaxID=698762 RepID=A0A1W1V6X4_9FIRM|nr:50S ribosomal protein L30 [Thermanaeromonas toyohensis]SMB88910.1 LSU ribosomal protein L30P [Thermanaeromonas toyohensis ToBE]